MDPFKIGFKAALGYAAAQLLITAVVAIIVGLIYLMVTF